MKNNNKGISILALDLTYKCNFRCLHCFNHSGEHNLGLKELTDDEILKLVDDIIELNPLAICLCGGEPLLRKELVYNVINKITKNSSIEVNMVTNGYLMTDEIAKKLKNAGVAGVQVSLDGASAKTHEWLRQKQHSFDKAINALKILNNNNINTCISWCPTKKNFNELEDTIKLCQEIGVSDFRVQPLMLLGRAKEELNDHCLSDMEYEKISCTLKEYNYSRKAGNMQLTWGDPLQHLDNSMVDVFLENAAITINAYGYIVPSPYIPLYTGNIRKYSLKEYWNNNLIEYIAQPIVRELFSMVKSTESMQINDFNKKIPINYKDKSIYLDWIDNREDFKKTVCEL